MFHLWEDNFEDYKLTDVLEIRFLELPKFRKAKPNLSKPLDRWLVFIEDSPEEVLKMLMKAEPTIAKAEEILEYLGSLDEIKRYYEAREMAVHDEVTRTLGAREEGLIEGKIEGKIEVAKRLISMGMETERIIEITGLLKEEVKSLQN